jgi:hypothetical protein
MYQCNDNKRWIINKDEMMLYIAEVWMNVMYVSDTSNLSHSVLPNHSMVWLIMLHNHKDLLHLHSHMCHQDILLIFVQEEYDTKNHDIVLCLVTTIQISSWWAHCTTWKTYFTTFIRLLGHGLHSERPWFF